MAIFTFAEPPLLSRSTIDRADEIRDDAERLARGWGDARVLPVDANGRSGIGPDGLRWEPSSTFGDSIPQDAVFIGVRDGVDLWTIRVEEIEGKTADPRGSLGRLGPDEAGLLVTALGILNWHATARFSPVDGSPTVPARAGWTRKSTVTGGRSSPARTPRSSPSSTTAPTTCCSVGSRAGPTSGSRRSPVSSNRRVGGAVRGAGTS